LSGIGGNPDAVIYNAVYTDFLRQFTGRTDYTLAAISLAPVLLAKAGLLQGKKFCVGMYEEDRDEFSFFEYENQQRAPIVVDGNVITAMGAAFREFAVSVAEKMGYKCDKGLWSEIRYPVNPEDYIFRLS
jgi:putative intracellular protease/amidase